jgi:gluconate 2-dehydrogenase gamma chain
LLAATALPLACRSQPARPPKEPFSDLAYFVPTEARVMDAWLEQLLPGGTPPGTPGARDAGVLYYIDKQLVLPQFQAVARGIRRAGVMLNRAAQKQGVGHFADLDAPSQKELLVRLQTNQLDGNTQKLFEVTLLLALEGFLGDPRYGGNKNGVVWASLGDSPACPHK